MGKEVTARQDELLARARERGEKKLGKTPARATSDEIPTADGAGGGGCCCGGGGGGGGSASGEAGASHVGGGGGGTSSRKGNKNHSQFANSSHSLVSMRDMSSLTSMSAMDEAMGRARHYAFINDGEDSEFFDHSHYELNEGNFEDYTIHMSKKVGEGSYGSVYKCTGPDGELMVAKELKIEKSTEDKIKQEIRMLFLVKDGPNIIKTYDLVVSPRGTTYIIMEYIKARDHRDLYKTFDDNRARYYLYQLLKALQFSHSHGIMHRDLKGDNILFDDDSGELRLIDWGFGEFYRPYSKVKKWCGTRYYKAPEIFLHYQYYDYAVDMWSFGCIMGAIVFRTPVLFRGSPAMDKDTENFNHVQAIVEKMGLDAWKAYLYKYRDPPYNFPYLQKYKNFPAVSRKKRYKWSKMVSSKNARTANTEAIDLLDRLLVVDHERRMTSKEALQHPYFAQLRELDSSAVSLSDSAVSQMSGLSGASTDASVLSGTSVSSISSLDCTATSCTSLSQSQASTTMSSLVQDSTS